MQRKKLVPGLRLPSRDYNPCNRSIRSRSYRNQVQLKMYKNEEKMKFLLTKTNSTFKFLILFLSLTSLTRFLTMVRFCPLFLAVIWVLVFFVYVFDIAISEQTTIIWLTLFLNVFSQIIVWATSLILCFVLIFVRASVSISGLFAMCSLVIYIRLLKSYLARHLSNQ